MGRSPLTWIHCGPGPGCALLAAASPWRSRITPPPPPASDDEREAWPLGQDEAPRRGEEPAEHCPLPDCCGRADRGAGPLSWSRAALLEEPRAPTTGARRRERARSLASDHGGDHISKGERAAWPWATRQRKNAGCTAGRRSLRTPRVGFALAQGQAPRRRDGLACRTPPRRGSPTCLRAAGASRSRAKAGRVRAD